MPVDPLTEPYILRGRVVTMGRDPAPDGVIDDGFVCIRGGHIEAVQDAGAPIPTGFAGAEVVRVGGTVYPGLVELHNHLSYNAIPLWQLDRKYLHSGHWQGTDEYRANVTKPAMVLANTAGNAEALVRFAECRTLLGGVTTSQGITLQANSGVRALFRGLVRNVESPTVAGLPAAKPRIGAPDDDLEKYLGKLHAAPECYLQHLSEGINDGQWDTAIKQFTSLQRPDGSWAIFRSLCGVHSTALKPEHFDVLAAHGGSIVWSPLSNFLLYGATTDVAAAKAAGVPVALGSDWAPSGTKNLLGELKVASVVSTELGGLFTGRDLCEMVTSTPADILGWGSQLGRIAPGMLADLIVVDDTTGDPFEHLVAARETGLTLVVIGGVPRVGQRRMMDRFASGSGREEIQVGSSGRVLDLKVLPGEVDLGVGFGEAQEKLADTLANLPSRAGDLDDALAVGWTPGVSLSASGLEGDLMPAGWREPEVRVVLEFEEEAGEAPFLAALRAGDLADWVFPMELEGATVPDDPGFLKKIVAAPNVPRFVKENLPALHGMTLAVPDDDQAAGSSATRPADDAPVETKELRHELFRGSELDRDARRRIAGQAILMLERYYVHLPMKRTMHAVDPLQRLRNLERELEQGRFDGVPDLDFHREVISVFDSLRDLHTAYRLPRPYRGKVAWLPFLIEECGPPGHERFVVTKLVVPRDDGLETGAEVLHWNGVPLRRFVRSLARAMPGGNPAARRARALNCLTLRSLTRGQIPDEDWVTIRYRSGSGAVRELEQPWLLFEPRRGPGSLSPESTGVAAAAGLGLDDHTDDLQQAKKELFAPAQMREEERLRAGGGPARQVTGGSGAGIPSLLPTVFRAFAFTGPGGHRYGYLRVFSFNVDDADRFVEEFARILRELPQRGLVIDIRGNGGGLIHAAERSLELLSPVPVEPEPAQFINTPATLRLCRTHRDSTRLPGLALAPWLQSMERSVASGATHSLGFPLTPPADCNRHGQVFQGPKVLVVDGLCYSAADMFAAGFQDHQMGTVIGTHPNTGAGGANVWSHRLLQFLSSGDPDHGGFRLLPQGADLRTAIRRTHRVGAAAGELVEDFGVVPDLVYHMTEEDILGCNDRLLAAAALEIESLPRHRLDVTESRNSLRLEAPGASFIEVTADRRPVATLAVNRTGRAKLPLPLPRPHGGGLELVAHAGGRPVARTRHVLRDPS